MSEVEEESRSDGEKDTESRVMMSLYQPVLTSAQYLASGDVKISLERITGDERRNQVVLLPGTERTPAAISSNFVSVAHIGAFSAGAPDFSRHVVYRGGDGERFWEVYIGGSLRGTVKAQKEHGDVIARFGSSWSTDSDKFCFIAEVCEDDKQKKSPYEWQCDGLGETLSNIKRPAVFLLNCKQMTVQCVWKPDAEQRLYMKNPAIDDNDQVYAVVFCYPKGKPLGLTYCSNYDTYIACASQEGKPLPGCSGFGQFCLQFIPKLQLLVWFESARGDLHKSVDSLMAISTAGKATRPLSYLDGIADRGLLRRSPYSTWVWFSSVRDSQRFIAAVDMESGEHREFRLPASVPSISSAHMLDLRKDDVALVHLSTNMFSEIWEVSLSSGLWQRKHTVVSKSPFVKSVTVEKVGNVQYILVVPEGDHRGLVLMPHGGPHSAATTDLDRHSQYMAERGLVLAYINYTGSLGMTDCPPEQLLGKTGQQDVDDCVAVLRDIQSKADYGRVGVFGGSHGGFLGAHLSSRLGDELACAVLRNPVIAIDQMIGVTDIPEWCLVEGAGLSADQLLQQLPSSAHNNNINVIMADSAALRERMRSASPLAHVDGVCAATLLGIGGGDLRVPPSQAKLWFHALRARQVPVRALMYEREGHSLRSQAKTEYHWLRQACDWLEDHLQLSFRPGGKSFGTQMK